ncbi:MAG: response regulator transcription factor, partial [Nitriliruptoraceae bacterium]
AVTVLSQPSFVSDYTCVSSLGKFRRHTARPYLGGMIITRLLIVHPETTLRKDLAREFTRHRYNVTTTAHGNDALHAALTDPPDLVITALNLPDIDGFELIRQLHDSTAVPIIATAHTQNTTITIRALSTGADDVLTHPFATVELIARSRALLRRVTRDLRHLNHTHGGVTFDFALRHASRTETTLTFTALEWRCLETFASSPKRLFTHHELINRIWGTTNTTTHRDALRTLIRRVRRTLNDPPKAPVFIETHPGVGYRWLSKSPVSSPPPSA